MSTENSTQTLIQRLSQLAQEHTAADSSIEGYAAHAAIKELLQNWESALSDGAALVQLIGDVEDVIKLLRGFEQAVKGVIHEQNDQAA